MAVRSAATPAPRSGGAGVVGMVRAGVAVPANDFELSRRPEGAVRLNDELASWYLSPVPSVFRYRKRPATVLGFGFGIGIPPPCPPNSQNQQPGAATGHRRWRGGMLGHSPPSSWALWGPCGGRGCPTGRGRGTLALPVAGGASFDASFHNLDLPNPPPTAPSASPKQNCPGFAGTQGEKRNTRLYPIASARSQAPTFTVTSWQKRPPQSKFGTK